MRVTFTKIEEPFEMSWGNKPPEGIMICNSRQIQHSKRRRVPSQREAGVQLGLPPHSLVSMTKPTKPRGTVSQLVCSHSQVNRSGQLSKPHQDMALTQEINHLQSINAGRRTLSPETSGPRATCTIMLTPFCGETSTISVSVSSSWQFTNYKTRQARTKNRLRFDLMSIPWWRRAWWKQRTRHTPAGGSGGSHRSVRERTWNFNSSVDADVDVKNRRLAVL